MPHKVGFRVVAVSGEDDHHRAKELNAHGPTVQGWQSPRFCSYPQEIILELKNRVRISKIQILSHQYLISSQIKVCVGDISDGMTPNLQNVRYKQLGYVSLSDNERTNFKARELKSIHVDIVGTYLRFIVYKNHNNHHNTCNQVGIVALNVIGEDIGKNEGDSSSNGKTGNKAGGYNRIPVPGMVYRRPDQISPLDDLTFDMYQDPEVAQIIRKLEAKKHEAVQQEKYDFAKRLKIAVMDLYKAGETLGKYEIEKRQAIDMEDYDKARRKKSQMEDFRMKIYEQLELPQLMGSLDKQNGGAKSQNGEHSNGEVSKPRIVPDDIPTRDDNGTIDRLAMSKPIINTYIAYEERALPGIRRQSHAINPEDYKVDSERSVRAVQNNMNEQDRRQASLPIEVFGIDIVQLAYSKVFSNREECLDDVREQVENFNSKNLPNLQPAKVLRAATFLVLKGLKDSVLSVFTKALHLLTALLQTFPAKNKISKSELAQTVDKILPELINKLGDKAQRQRVAAHLYILEMVDYPDVKALNSVPTQCCQPLTTHVHPRLAQGQAELVEQLVNKLGVDKNSGLTMATVMGFAVPALQHPSSPIRETTERIIANLYREKGAEVKRYLPPSETATKKTTIYRQLYETFDRIDQESQKRRSSVISELSNVEATQKRRNSLAALTTPELVERMENSCIFCNEKNDSFTSEGLDLHYWHHCPMLVKCTYCKQVVEISALTDHHLVECEFRDNFIKCKRCQEAILKKDYDVHNKLRTCTPAKMDKGANRCPLCHRNVGSGEQGWKTHLMGKNGCEKNPRRKSNAIKKFQIWWEPPIQESFLQLLLMRCVCVLFLYLLKIAAAFGDRKMKKSQSADRALTVSKSDKVQSNRMSRSTTRTFNQPATKWR